MPKGYGQYPPYPDPFPGGEIGLVTSQHSAAMRCDSGKGFPVRGPAGPSPNKGFSQKGGPAAPGYPGFVPSPVAYEGYQYQFSMHSMGPAGPVPGPGRRTRAALRNSRNSSSSLICSKASSCWTWPSCGAAEGQGCKCIEMTAPGRWPLLAAARCHQLLLARGSRCLQFLIALPYAAFP